MQIYEPLALRYRPKTLSEVVGQDHIVSVLRGMFKQQKVPRSLLVHGPFGSGKTSLARIIAKTVNCQNVTDDADPCGECASCTIVDSNQPHPCIMEINAADSRGIDTIRDLIQQASFAPQFNYRVYILDESHQVTSQGQATLLKILEEPPKHTIFILTTTDAPKLLKTIRSRCIDLAVKPVPVETVAQLVTRVAHQEQIQVEENTAMQIAQAVQGHPRDALATLEKVMHYASAKQGPVEELLPEIVAELIEESPETLVRRYVACVLRGKRTPALRLVKSVSSHEYFTQRVIHVLKQVMFCSINPKLTESYYRQFATEIIIQAQSDPIISSAIMRKYLRTLQMLKEYAVDAADLLALTTVESCNLIRKNLE